MVKRAAAQVNKGIYQFRRFEEPEDIFLEDLRGAVWNANVKWKTLAERADIGQSTVKHFAYGDTKRPTFHTIFKLCRALNMRLVRSEFRVVGKGRK